MKNIDAQILKFDEWNEFLFDYIEGQVGDEEEEIDLIDMIEEMYDVIKRQQKQMQEWEYDADLIMNGILVGGRVSGEIFNDKKKRFMDSENIYTTGMKFFRTRNTTYRIIQEPPMTKKNPIAKALKSPHLKPKKINSKKIYKRKPKHKDK